MVHMKASHWMVGLGAVLLAAGALASEQLKLHCPAGTRQTEFVSDGSKSVHCARTDASGVEVKHGPAVLFHPNGQMAAKGQFDSGFRAGTWNDFNQDGVHIETVEVQRGHLHGRRVVLFPNGAQRLVEEYRNGVRHGMRKEFSPTGQLVRATKYQAGIAVTK